MKESPRWLCREQSSRSRLCGPISMSDMDTDEVARIVQDKLSNRIGVTAVFSFLFSPNWLD